MEWLCITKNTKIRPHEHIPLYGVPTNLEAEIAHRHLENDDTREERTGMDATPITLSFLEQFLVTFIRK